MAKLTTPKPRETPPTVSSPKPPSSPTKRVLVFDIVGEIPVESSGKIASLSLTSQLIVQWMQAFYAPDVSEGATRVVYILGPPRIKEVREEKGQGKETVGCGPLKSPANER